MKRKTLDRHSIFHLWKLGTPLSEAASKFSSRKNAREIVQLDASDVPPRRGQKLDLDQPDDKRRQLLEIHKIFAQGISELREAAAWNAKLQSDLLVKLERGLIIAVGYDATKSKEQLPEIISHRFLEPRFFKWASSEISDGAIRFVRVRIVLFGKSSTEHQPAEAGGALGRPSDGPAILAAIEEVKKAQPTFPKLGRKSQRELVKPILVSTLFNRKIPSDRTIEKYLRHAFQNKPKR